MVQLNELREAIRSHHVKTFTPRQQRMLALTSLGAAGDEVAAVVGLAEPSVRRELARIRDVICIPLGTERFREVSAAWAVEHSDCCLWELAIA